MRRVSSADGTQIALSETGDPAAPVLVCVHGYPDNARLWAPVAQRLADHFRVVTYDVRGAGDSDHPRGRAAYRLDRLEEDFTAVLDAVSPDQPVHLLAHDWGSIQSWHFVTSEALRGRIESFVSISGPSLDHAGYFFRSRRPVRDLVDQLVHSWYIFYFQLPWLPERGWRKGWALRVFGRLERSAGGSAPSPGERSLTDFVNGLELYRANLLPRLLRPRPRRTDIPVLAVSPDGDAFVTTPLQTDVARWAPNLSVQVVRGGHWLPRNDPGLVARLTLEHTRRVAGWQV
ncbi:alpha/beta hydrolase fold protein [Kribbella flavida DSM 17836]|uniref:Alpha/beta hydrolase fold protein n=1 Tax=Kribbella flavida (strain DSM 17836 / JCM 10339 / NBRC 14399) TaxID=479435 RepID=D2PLP7_KRIFD|nr:alpha/beta fold hydrolase [Kribbella flavida]ADB32477.1 alpha/beta hydrolase fold protein [Kribbella flavida DSM 17836]